MQYIKKISMISLIIIVVLSVLPAITGCAKPNQQIKPAQTPATQKLPAQITERPAQYTNTQYGFAFNVCNNRDFEFIENYAGATAALLGPLLRDFKHRIGIYVILDKLPQKTSLEDYLKKQQEAAKSNLDDFTIADETDITVGNIPAKLSHSTFTITTDDNVINYKTSVAAFAKNGTVYAIQYETDAALYDEYSDCFNTILSSFRFN